MKSKTLMVVLCLGLVSQQWALSQTDTNSVTTNEPAMNVAAPVAPSRSMAAVATNMTESVNTSNTPAMSPVTAKPSSVTEGANEGVTGSQPPRSKPTAVLPIQFQDVPITTAIQNLARLAGINYLLDPKIGYGQPGKNGQIKPEPTISVRWENVSPRQALLAVLDNYNLQLVEDPQTKIARITIKNPNAPPPLITRVIQLKYASVTNMMIAVDSALTDKRSRVVPDARTSEMVVVATEKEQEAVETLVAKLDKPTRQVLIATRLIDVASTPSTSKGIDWAGTLQAQNITFGNGNLSGQTTIQSPTSSGTTTTTYPGGRSVTSSTSGSSVSSVLNYVLGNGGLSLDTARGFSPATAFLNADGVAAVLSFLNQDSDAQTIATPRVVTLDNEPAHIEVTRAQPIFNTTAGTQGSPGGSQVLYTNLGTILDVTPHITANNWVWLNVQPEVSDDAGPITRTVANQTYQADVYDIRKVKTQVMIPNANTLVMGGFIKDNTQNSYTKVPILGDIPVLGDAFRSETKKLDKENLLIFITPTIVQPDDFQPTTTDFLQSSPATPKSPMNPRTAWNSAKPYDWSNPKETDPYYDAANPQAIDVPTPKNATSQSGTNAPATLPSSEFQPTPQPSAQ